ncbi:MAG: hypothetical protein ACKO1J_15510, partial [Tagaea sp.]
YLPFNDAASTTTISQDRSGNGNNWTSSGISVTAGTTFDQMLDTPTNNYATMNPIWAGANGFSRGNLRVSPNSNQHATISVDSGAFYFEATLAQLIGSSDSTGVGIVNLANSSDSRYIRSRLSDCAVKTTTAAEATGFGFWSPGEIIGIAFNPTTNFFEVRRNNVVQASSSSAGLSGAVWVPQIQSQSSAQLPVWDLNFGQLAFAYTPPTGFVALNTANLPTPTIPRGDDAFQTLLYNGNGGTLDVTGARFQPDFVWAKERNSADNHALANGVVGLPNWMPSNQSLAELTTSEFAQFLPNGVRLGGAGNINSAGASGVTWLWRRGAAYGFDIVAATGTGANRAIAHGLNAVPHFMIAKRRDASGDWVAYHRSLAADNFLYLNLPNAAAVNATFWNGAPNSSVFNVGTQAATNANGGTYVHYLWTSIPGFSRFGGYAGNGSADGTFVWCGFRPRFILIKNITGATSWSLFDTAINPANQAGPRLIPNLAAAEAADGVLDILSSGFKLRENNANTNGAATNYVFAAFAETPFKFANAR